MLGIGVVGAGYWGPNLIRNLALLPNCRLTSVCDSDATRLRKIHLTYPMANIYEKFDSLIADPLVDAVVIATPAALHFDHASKALEAGKHVLVEKPLATRLDECWRLLELAANKDRVLMVGHTFEYSEPVIRLRKLVRDGELGRIHYLSSQRLNLGRIRNDVNVIWNLAPHDFSILNLLLGEAPRSISVQGFEFLRTGVTDVAFITLAYPSGARAQVHVSWLDPRKVRQLTVVGDRKMVVYDDIDPEQTLRIYDKGVDRVNPYDKEYSNFGEFRLLVRSGDLLIPRIEADEPIRLECEHFIECILEDRSPRSDGASGCRVVAILEACDQSLREGGATVPVEGKLLGNLPS